MEEAELWAVLLGLQIAWARNIRKVVIGVDSENAWEWLTGTVTERHKHAALLQECRQLLLRNWEARVTLIYREGNSVADFLAKKALVCSPFGASRQDRAALA